VWSTSVHVPMLMYDETVVSFNRLSHQSTSPSSLMVALSFTEASE